MLRDKIIFVWRRVRAARSARRAPRDTETRVQFVDFVNSPKKNFLANPSETLPQGRSSFLIAGSPFLKNSVELKVRKTLGKYYTKCKEFYMSALQALKEGLLAKKEKEQQGVFKELKELSFS